MCKQIITEAETSSNQMNFFNVPTIIDVTTYFVC